MDADVSERLVYASYRMTALASQSLLHVTDTAWLSAVKQHQKHRRSEPKSS